MGVERLQKRDNSTVLNIRFRWFVHAAASLLLSLLAATAATAEAEKVIIPLIGAGKPDARDTSVTGWLTTPGGNGPFPAVILMHGCDGVHWGARGGGGLMQDYAGRYAAMGYVALVLDSFEARGVSSACNRPLTVSPERRAWDAFSAARWLAQTGLVDTDRIVLQGHSHGAVAVLVALKRGRPQTPEHFAAAIAWYPGCRWAAGGVNSPLLILIGGADEWTPARECRDFVARLTEAGESNNVQLVVFPGATHAFDAHGGYRVIFGHPITPSPTAAEQAWSQVQQFLQVRLGKM